LNIEPIVDSLAGLDPGAALDGAAGRLLASLAPPDAASALAALLGRAGDAREKKALWALCRALHFGPLDGDRKDEIRRAAFMMGLGEVVALFTEAAARRVDDEALRPPDKRDDTAATLGARTQAARGERRPERLLRLCVDPHPAVIRNLLLNARLTEAHVLRIAARRPVDARVLEEVGRSPRWSRRPAVRRALALNPYAAPALAVSLLPGLGRVDLEEVAGSGTLHDYVRESARALLAARERENA
jgi:hypothetical protein